MTRPNPPARVRVLLARKAPVGVVFRRGPSKWVQVLRWDTTTDTFEAGQWFHGRLHERRCDLSPGGDLLVYFASKIDGRTIRDREYTHAWTAISRPPYLTALALWPKGDTWHGGGLFETRRRLWLNHAPEVAIPHPDHRPKFLTVTPNESASGEDFPVWSRRMERDGWRRTQAGSYPMTKTGWTTEQPETWERESPNGDLTLVQSLDAVDFKQPGGPYRESFTLRDREGRSTPIEDAEWADWDQAGRLVFARAGGLWCLDSHDDTTTERLLVDLTPNEPEERAAPSWAQEWPFRSD
ncbi:MAG: hypothetical protein AAF533_03935 [Acidobacteriota bacterium]